MQVTRRWARPSAVVYVLIGAARPKRCPLARGQKRNHPGSFSPRQLDTRVECIAFEMVLIGIPSISPQPFRLVIRQHGHALSDGQRAA